MCVAQKLEPKIAAESVKSVLEELEVGETSVTGGLELWLYRARGQMLVLKLLIYL